jgi:hypothetical protein
MNKVPCPLCGQSIDGDHQVSVCSGCHHSLAASAAPTMRSTGEYSVAEIASAAEAAREMAEQSGGPRRKRPVTAPNFAVCSWCNKPRREVKKLLSKGQAHICNECVALCSDILQAELGDDWRG